MEIFLLWIVFSFVAGAVGSGRKIGFFGAFLLSIILSPLIGLIIAFASKSKADEKFQQELLRTQKLQNSPLNDRLDPPSTVVSLDEELRKLKALKDDGLITEDEFEEQKRKLLNR